MNKKLLYLIPYPKFFSQHAGVGGHVAHAAGIVRGFVDEGYEVSVVTEENHEIFSFPGVTVNVIPCSSQSIWARQFWALKLLSVVKKLVHENSYELCYMRYSAGFTPWIPSLKSMCKSLPVVVEVNSLGSQWRKFLRPFDLRALNSVDRIICISETLNDFICKLSPEKLTKKVRTVVNGVDIERFSVQPKLLGSDNNIHIGFAGLLKQDYGLETLIEAAELLGDHNVRIHIFGDGPHKISLESLSAKLSNVTFHGPIPFVEMPAHLNGMDILVYTTGIKHLYQSPTKLFEYMAAGKGIVCARTPQTSKLLKDHKTALFYDVNDAVGLSNAVIELASSPELNERLGSAAKVHVSQSHTWKQRVAEILLTEEASGS